MLNATWIEETRKVLDEGTATYFPATLGPNGGIKKVERYFGRDEWPTLKGAEDAVKSINVTLDWVIVQNNGDSLSLVKKISTTYDKVRADREFAIVSKQTDQHDSRSKWRSDR